MNRALCYETIRHPVYKYRVVADFTYEFGPADLPTCSGEVHLVVGGTTWAALDLSEGLLAVYEGYAWDGASGPAFDTVSILRASLVHDVLYQMIAERYVPILEWKAAADEAFHRICLDDAMNEYRALMAFFAVRSMGRARDGYLPV